MRANRKRQAIADIVIGVALGMYDSRINSVEGFAFKGIAEDHNRFYMALYVAWKLIDCFVCDLCSLAIYFG
jgi:hypothetical protein